MFYRVLMIAKAVWLLFSLAAFGADGRYVITSPADSGPGSLREAVEASGPRVIVLRTSVRLERDLVLRNGRVAIAGGEITGRPVRIIGASDVLLQDLRIRPGDPPAKVKAWDCLTLEGVSRFHARRCSFQFGSDECVDVFTGCSDIRFEKCIIAWSLVAAGVRSDASDGHSCLMRIGPDAHNVRVYGCLFAYGNRRCPLAVTGTELWFVNNAIVAPGSQPAALDGPGTAPIEVYAVGNCLVPRVPGRGSLFRIEKNCPPGSKLHSRDNTSGGEFLVAEMDGAPSGVVTNAAPRIPGALPSGIVVQAVLHHAGAQPRDKVDAALVSTIVRDRTGKYVATGKIINAVADLHPPAAAVPTAWPRWAAAPASNCPNGQCRQRFFGR